MHFRGYVVISVRLVYQLCRQILFSEEANENNSSQVVHVDIFSLLILMMELYKLQIVHCQVIYELIRYFAGNLSELNAQCLLVMIRRCGAELRRDDPRALKDIIEYIREQAQQQKESDKMSKVFSTRLEMILELIYDWKDNKLVNKDANQSFPWVTNQITTSPFTVRSLQFSLEELQDWHIFYANWSGNQEPKNTVNQTVLVQEETSQATPINTDSVDKIIRQQRLNTDTRRNIFRMIMTAEDVVDAEHRLVEYGGKRKSLLREIANMVIVGCCYERSFNPFYVALTKRLCLCSSRYKIAFQFSLWNIWKRMEQGEKWSSVKLSNLASYIAQLIFDRVVTFSCFRVLPNLSHFTPSLRTLLFLILEKAKTRTNDDLLVLLQENISDKRCHAFYLTLYFLLLESKQDNHPRTSGWFHLLQSSGILQV